MNKTTKIIIICLVLLLVLYWGLSNFFTSLTFSPEMEAPGDPLAYEQIQYDQCTKTNWQSKDLTIKFSYKYPLVNFRGKLEVIDKNDKTSNPEGKLLFSGKYKDKIILKNLCYSLDNQASLYKDLEFRFSDENAEYWFYSDVGDKGYPFLKHNKIEVKIDWFSIHPSKPYQITPLE